MVAMHALTFEPILKPRVWGGRRLAELGKVLPPGEPIGESWELADLPEAIEGGRSVVDHGPLSGRTLHEVVREHPDALLGRSTPGPDGGFPLLVKYLDAREPLSVQVHPDEAWAASHPGHVVKHEAWVVLEADPGASIQLGLQPGMTRDLLAAAIEDGTLDPCLARITARPGACHVLPGGTCHALGGGILVAEIQTPSDTTFRLFDWGRSGRDLHVTEALACIHFGDTPPAPAEPDPLQAGSLATTTLAATPCFGIERIEAIEATDLEVVVDDAAVVWMMLEGEGVLHHGDDPAGEHDVVLSPGRTVLLPASIEAATASLSRGSHLLRVETATRGEPLLA